jgi:thymidylate synthase
MVSAWNVGDLDKMTLPPCHYGFQVYTKELDETERVKLMDKHLGVIDKDKLPQHYRLYYTEKQLSEHNIPTRAISLMWNQRSVDVGLGLPFNIASYALLLEIIAKEVNMIPEEVIGNLGDCHIYLNHIDGLKEQLTRTPYELPKLDKLPDYLCIKDNWECYEPNDIKILNYQSHPAIKLPLSN